MYLHAGNGKIIKKSSVIGIFDMDTSTISGITRKYLSDMEKQKNVSSAIEEVPKSFILYFDEREENPKNKYKICISQISASVLTSRMMRDEFSILKK